MKTILFLFILVIVGISLAKKSEEQRKEESMNKPIDVPLGPTHGGNFFGNPVGCLDETYGLKPNKNGPVRTIINAVFGTNEDQK
ncbi:hypothetical protein AKO1_004809 [Acrasis kona]|uniref:Uncharacterized protein n=1 Tax=Acrasis kona TaxID=1008807 RepID=A0AAW2Z4K5_9EUKA